jgi:hypothetical protein
MITTGIVEACLVKSLVNILECLLLECTPADQGATLDATQIVSFVFVSNSHSCRPFICRAFSCFLQFGQLERLLMENPEKNLATSCKRSL